MEPEFNDFIHKEGFRTLTGRLLGRGAHRAVFLCAIDPSLVVKVETDGGSFQNVMEWETWKIAAEYEWPAKLFAPCLHISPCGSVLVQRRTEAPLSYPPYIPDIWTDLKLTNFGLLDGRLVCHDYGLNRLPDSGLARGKPHLVKARWWDLNDIENRSCGTCP